MSAPGAGAPPAELRRELPDLAATQRLGAALARLLRAGDVVALWGDLGAGKTTLARTVIAALGHRGDVPSPTFTLVQVYELEPVPLWHFDFYRIDDPRDIAELGFEQALGEAISLIEWPQRMGALLPADRLDIELSYGATEDSRCAVLRGQGAWQARLAEARDDV